MNLSIRKFLKAVGVSSQREIEQAVAEAIEAGTIGAAEALAASMTLHIGRCNLKSGSTERYIFSSDVRIGAWLLSVALLLYGATCVVLFAFHASCNIEPAGSRCLSPRFCTR